MKITSKLFLATILLSLMFVQVSCVVERPQNERETAIVIKAKTDEGVILQNKATRAQDPTQYFLTVTGPNGKIKDEQVLGSLTKIPNVDPGQYTVTLTSLKEADFNLPDYNKPIYKGTKTETVYAEESTRFDITCTQMNVGVKFVFSQAVTEYYTSLMGTITDSSDASKSLTLGPDDQGVKTAYFEAPSKLKLTFTNNGTPIKVGSKDFIEISTSPKELWTITFKTSSQNPGDIEVEVDVDEGTDDKDPEYGLGDVIGEGTLESPYSVADAVNAMPANNVWVEGYIRGSLPTTRAGTAGNVLLGKQTSSSADDCIAIELPADSDIYRYLNLQDESNQSNLNMRIAVRGNISGKGDFAPGAIAVVSAASDFMLDYTSDYEPFNYKYPDKTLKSSAPFKIGTAVSHEGILSEPAYVEILKRDFNSITSTYTMKMNVIWAGGDRTEFDYSYADILVNFAIQNNMRVHGHTLIWSQDNVIPDWVKALDLDREGWTDLMKEYITAVVTYYAGKVASWDVVNEAFNNDDGNLRGSKPGDDNTFWYDKVGEDFMSIAFHTAKEALTAAGDTECKLFYNDYMFANDDKRINMLAHLKQMKDNGVPIDGIGLQMHYDVRPDYPQLKKAFTEVAALGVLVHASEIDMLINSPTFIREAQIGVPPDGPWILGESATKYELYYGVPGKTNFNMDYAQGKSYNMAVSAFMQCVPDEQKYGVTTWGFDDGHAYATTETHYRFYDYPMMFTTSYRPKRAYAGVLEGLNGIDWEQREKDDGWDWRWSGGEFEPKAPWE